jgi:hypothetical protein
VLVLVLVLVLEASLHTTTYNAVITSVCPVLLAALFAGCLCAWFGGEGWLGAGVCCAGTRCVVRVVVEWRGGVNGKKTGASMGSWSEAVVVVGQKSVEVGH